MSVSEGALSPTTMNLGRGRTPAEEPTATRDDVRAAFHGFAGANGEYYADTFLRLQKNELPATHVNWSAALGTFAWAALRGNWFLFWIGFAIDLLAACNVALWWKYSEAALANAERAYLVSRYEAWASSHLWGAILVFVLGRLLFGWLADRLYYRQYSKWRIDHSVNSGVDAKRVVIAALVFALIAPLMLYRSANFAPSDRECIKQSRAVDAGEEVAFKARFDCAVISEFPTLFWLDRRDEVNYVRQDDGSRVAEYTPARASLPPQNLNAYSAQLIDDGIRYVTAFYGGVLDTITNGLRSMLTALTALFVGTPWPIMMGLLVALAYAMAGGKVAVFVVLGLAYLALFGFWHTAMDTLALVATAAIICIVIGLPLGVWVGKSERGSAIVTPVLDVMQTIPSFVYLLPAIAFFSVGKPPGILATIIFAMPPIVRLTALGIRHVPESTKEAALAFGANPRQLLTKVELPLALPSIMAGINQVVMMSLSMVVVAALVGAGGLGFLVTEALANSRTGSGLLAGIAIALLAMMIDRVVQRANAAKR